VSVRLMKKASLYIYIYMVLHSRLLLPVGSSGNCLLRQPFVKVTAAPEKRPFAAFMTKWDALSALLQP
jgi:hypothetical protein